MKHTYRLLSIMIMGGFLLAVLVLGGYLALTQAASDQHGALAQETLSCEQVLALLSQQAQITDCSNMPDSSACYGHHRVRYEPQGGETVVFDEPGETALLRKLKTIATEPLDLTTGDWGVALLQTQLAENGQPINAPPAVFMLYGAATIENAGDESSAPANQTYLDGMHAFYFDTRGLGLTPECRDLPVGGVAIESPEGYRVSFTANEVEIVIGSTVVLQAVPYEDMHVTVLDGHAVVSAVGGTVNVGVGQEAVISLGGPNGLQADRPPQLRDTGSAQLALPQVCQLATWGGITMPCFGPPPAQPTPLPTPPPTSTGVPVTAPVVGPFVTANVNANVRAGDNTMYEVIGALLAGKTAPVLGLSCTGSGWFLIQLSGRQGFISNLIVTLTGSTAGLPCFDPPPRPADSDVDGFVDTVDHCPYAYAPDSYDGCPVPTATAIPTEPPVILSDLVVYLADRRPAVDCPSNSGPVLMKQGGDECVTAIEVMVQNVSHGNAVQAFALEVSATGGGYWNTVVYGLAPGESRSFTAVLQTSCYLPDCAISAVVDSGNAVPELDETNNRSGRRFVG